MKKPRCHKCGKTIYKKDGMYIISLFPEGGISDEEKTYLYHWDCYVDEKYNQSITKIIDKSNEKT